MGGNSPWSFLSVMLSQTDFDFQVGRKPTILLETQVLPWFSRNLWRGKVNTRTENRVEMKVYVPFFDYFASFTSFMLRKSAIAIAFCLYSSKVACLANFKSSSFETDTQRFKLYWAGNLFSGRRKQFSYDGAQFHYWKQKESLPIFAWHQSFFRPFTFLFRHDNSYNITAPTAC